MGFSFEDVVAAVATSIIGPSAALAIDGHTASHEAAAKRGRMDDDASSRWTPDRAIVNDEYTRLSNDFDGMPAPKEVQPEAFETWSHRDIFDALNGADGGPGVSASDVNAGADAWRRLTAAVDDSITEYDATIQRVVGEMWSGQAANAAVDGVREYASRAQQLPTAFQMVANGIDLMEGYLSQSKMSIPEPEELNGFDEVVGHVPGNGVFKMAKHRANEAEAAAQQVMTNIYQPGSVTVDSQTPILPVAKNTIGLGDLGQGSRGTIGPEPGNTGNDPGAMNIENPTSSQTGHSPTGTDTPWDPGEQSTDPASVTMAATPQTTAQSATTPGIGSPGGAGSGVPGSGASGMGGLGSAVPGTGAGGSGTAGPGRNIPSPRGSGTSTGPGAGARGAGTGMRAMPGTGAGGSGAGGPGRSVSGPRGGGVLAGPGAGSPAAAARGTGAGMGGMPGMAGGAPGRGGGKDDEVERTTPDYLIQERETELIGELPKVLPPGGAIGE
ncbi:PPE domain-containing protein [Nocardia sp. CNY236]|uniref:PPE domain-containing protein n=1 Tax=Nocardia sp. CNY236 TaxID=1169152 RepID=UPI0003FAC85E|nr:PPE domain-containing protein [Nocardia sp. CNY236]